MSKLDMHVVSLAVIAAHDGLPVITARCECGWHANFAEVTTFDAVESSVNEHHIRVLQGIVR